MHLHKFNGISVNLSTLDVKIKEKNKMFLQLASLALLVSRI